MTKQEHIFSFDPNKKGIRKILGDLESEIMEHVWTLGEVTVRKVYDRLKARREIAYTTVMTVMSRLADKGILKRIRAGNAFKYRATSTRDDFTRSAVRKIVNELLDDFAAPAMSQFIESLSEVDEEKIGELARLIEEKRKKRNV